MELFVKPFIHSVFVMQSRVAKTDREAVVSTSHQMDGVQNISTKLAAVNTCQKLARSINNTPGQQRMLINQLGQLDQLMQSINNKQSIRPSANKLRNN